ncbi:MAG TPA: MFS transporter [Rhodopila sp.]|uniref:MFS transporter n=1 Tax=Rhodopila sp. TaxID=2480087 RepID=UPI002D0F9ABE|nr:MFS transporter [Rhodopila sp.]HVY15142.1 MFS transporter [Rhodopila sp.]
MTDALEARTMAKVSRRLLPYAVIGYFIAYLDRVNLSFAALEMNKELGFTATVYGAGAGMFFLSYFALETPSNLILVKTGARRWLARIMITWGLISGAMAFVNGETSFYIVRFLLGAAEAGFFPGIMYFLTLFFPAKYRGHMVGIFMAASPVSAVVGAPASTLILGAPPFLGLHGWQLVFILEAVPALILGVITLFYLQDSPAEAHWLDDAERAWLVGRQAVERRQRETVERLSVTQVLFNPRVLTLGVAGFSIAYSIYGIVYFLPQIVKQFGLTNMQVGLVSAIPFAVGAVGMIWYGRRSDRVLERRSHTSIALTICALGLMVTALTPNPYVRLAALSVASFGAFAVLPVFWSMPTAFLSGAAAAAGVAYINSLANIAGFVAPFVMGWIKDATGSFNGGLLVIACICCAGAIATLCVHHDRALETNPESAGI